MQFFKLFPSLFLEFFSNCCSLFLINVDFLSPSTYSGPILKIKWTFFTKIKSRVLLLSKNYSFCLNCQLQMQIKLFHFFSLLRFDVKNKWPHHRPLSFPLKLSYILYINSIWHWLYKRCSLLLINVNYFNN